MVDIQVAHTEFGIITLLCSIERTLRLRHAPTLAGRHIGKVLRSVGFHPSAGLDTLGNTVVALHVAGQQRHHEAKVVGLCLKLHVSQQAIRVVYVGCKAGCLGMEGGGQRQFKVVEVHVLQVTLYIPLDSQRIVRPPLLELLGHSPHKLHKVGSAHLGIYMQAHLAGVYLLRQREGHVKRHKDIRLGGLQAEAGQFQTTILHADRPAQFRHLQTVFLMECHIAHKKA